MVKNLRFSFFLPISRVLSGVCKVWVRIWPSKLIRLWIWGRNFSSWQMRWNRLNLSRSFISSWCRRTRDLCYVLLNLNRTVKLVRKAFVEKCVLWPLKIILSSKHQFLCFISALKEIFRLLSWTEVHLNFPSWIMMVKKSCRDWEFRHKIQNCPIEIIEWSKKQRSRFWNCNEKWNFYIRCFWNIKTSCLVTWRTFVFKIFVPKFFETKLSLS